MGDKIAAIVTVALVVGALYGLCFGLKCASDVLAGRLKVNRTVVQFIVMFLGMALAVVIFAKTGLRGWLEDMMNK